LEDQLSILDAVKIILVLVALAKLTENGRILRRGESDSFSWLKKRWAMISTYNRGI
jgi:hypothetical protein